MLKLLWTDVVVVVVVPPLLQSASSLGLSMFPKDASPSSRCDVLDVAKRWTL